MIPAPALPPSQAALPTGRRLRVLLVNDDGVEAPGLHALFTATAALADVTVVAPATERSAAGHSITVFNELSLRRHTRDHHAEAWWGLDGTPADCVKMALTVIMRDAPPDIVVSGVNRGQNTGTSILYSGTVAGAREAAMAGLPAIAVSLAVTPPPPTALWEAFALPLATATGPASDAMAAAAPTPSTTVAPAPADFALASRSLARDPAEFTHAAVFAADLAIDTVRRATLPRGTILNVNVPMLHGRPPAGVAVAPMGHSLFVDDFQVMREIEGIPHYRNMGDRFVPTGHGRDWDDLVLRRGMVAVTPLRYDLTHHEFLADLREWFPAG